MTTWRSRSSGSLSALTELWAELRQRARHEPTGLVLAHDVGDLLSATLGLGAMEGRQRVFAYNVTLGHKVAAGGLMRPVHAARLPQHDAGGQLGCPVGAAPSVAVVAAAEQVVQDAAAAQSGSQHPLLLGGLGPDA